MKILDYIFLCHKKPERSFFYKGKQFPICARCTGIFVGYLLAIVSSIFVILPVEMCLILLIPIAIDGTGQYLGKWTSNNIRRFYTGILAGIATIYLLLAIWKVGFSHGHNLIRYLKDS